MSSFSSECPNCGKPVNTDDETGLVLEACCPWCDYAFYGGDELDKEQKAKKRKKRSKRGKASLS